MVCARQQRSGTLSAVTANARTRAIRRLLLLLALLPGTAAAVQEFTLSAPAVIHRAEPFAATLTPSGPSDGAPRYGVIRVGGEVIAEFVIGGEPVELSGLRIDQGGALTLRAELDGAEIASTPTRAIGGWISILPPLIAIGLALWLRTVVPAIFAGLWIGVLAREGFTAGNLLPSVLDAFQVDVLAALADADHAAILLFSCMIGGMVGIVSRNGGMQGVVNHVLRWANSPRRGQISVWFLGLAVFFDDYTNTLVVGSASRPVTDRLRISREKLAYIVDSTAAPIACLALVTTWIGYEVGLIGEATKNLEGFDQGAYIVFLHSIPYSFYPILALLFVFLIAWTGRDFGPMLAAEKRSYTTGQVAPYRKVTLQENQGVQGVQVETVEGAPIRAVNAVVPVVLLIGGSIAGLFLTGDGDTVQEILGSADAYKALMWGSLLGVLAAMLLTLGQRIMSIHDVMAAWMNGVNVMIPPLVILVLAWALSGITDTLGTADYLARVAGDVLLPQTIPAWTFVIAAAAAFATGTSWGVMAILLPIFVPVAWATMVAAGIADASHYYIIHSTVAAILAGAVWGDHCSPISDTTVLSSMASHCDHIEHVRTQLPYAMAVAGVALIAGIIPTGFGLPWWIALPVCAVLLVAVVRFFGKPSGDAHGEAVPAAG
jgi:Na+/H+ antiporter NhaC